MNKKILYIGNKLSKQGLNVSTIETLGANLSTYYTVVYSSSKQNKVLRLLHMIFATIKSKFNKTNVVLIDTYSTYSFYYTLIISQLCRILNLKYIPILHGGNLPERFKKNPKLCDLIFQNAYKNVAPSMYLYTIFCEKYSNVVHIPNTVNTEDYPFLERKIQTPKLLWVRSFASIYNPQMAIYVFANIKKQFPEATLCMIGPDKENLINDCRILAKKLEVEVLFTGKLSKKEWIEKSKKYNIFINTTNVDNMPVSVIEAMSLGLPVISTNVGGIKYLIKDKVTGVLVNANAVTEMTEKINFLVKNPDIVDRITTNALSEIQNFDWKKVAPLWLKVLD